MKSFHAFLNQVGNNVRRVRSRLGWSQVETSEKAGIPARRYQAIEAGTANVTLRILFRLARALNKSPRELI